MVGSKNTNFRSQSQRMEAALAGSNKSSRTPPPIGMSRQPGLLSPPGLPARPKPGSGKLNTPTKKLPSSSSAHGAAAGAGQGVVLSSAHAYGAAGQQHGRSEFDFPDDDDEDDQLQAAYAASMVQATGCAANSSGGAGAAAAGPAKPKARLKPQADRQKQILEEEQQRRQPDAQRASFPRLSTAGSHSRDGNAGAAWPAGAFCSQAQGLAASAAGAARLAQAPGGKQLGIRQFARTMPPGHSNTSGPLPAGMLNHGNTCYLNAILQALLSLPSLAGDLIQFDGSSSNTLGSRSAAARDLDSSLDKSSDSSFSQLKLPPDGVTAAMVACLRQYQVACRAGDGGGSGAAISPRMVREAMKKRASHWGAARQEDAHEFFTALLNALADEVQQAQLEHMQHNSSSRRCQQSTAGAACTVAEVTEGEANCAVKLPASADAPAHYSQQDAAVATAEAAVEPQLADEQGPDRQPQQQQHRDSSPAVEALQPSSRQSTPACQLPSMSVSQALCPVTRNFLGCLQHTYTCSVCGKSTVQKEQFNHLILDLPQDEDSGSSGAAAAGGSGLLGAFSNGNKAPVADLSSLLANHFNPETCEKACEGCGASAVQHRVEHAIRRLPRVLVVQLKRFKWVISPSGIPDCSKMPTPVQPDKQLFLGRICVPGRPVPPLLASLMPQRLVRSAMEAVGDHQHRHQQQKLLLDSSAAAGCGGSNGAAAVADGRLDGLLALANSNADAAAGPGQRQDQRQKPMAKRLGNLRPQGDVPVPKKPKVVDGDQFGPTKHTGGSLASFWGNKDGSRVHGVHVPKVSPLDRPQQQQQQRAASPDLHAGPWGDSNLAGDPGALRRNNSSSAVPHVDLTGLADAADAAAESEYDRDLQLALALSMQEQQPRQQLQLSSGPTEGAEVPQVDSDWPSWSHDLPDWIQTGHVPAAAAAAPPPSPVKSRGNSVDDSRDQGLAAFGSYEGQDGLLACVGKQQQGSGPVNGAPVAAAGAASSPAAAIPDAELLALTPVDASAAEPTAVADACFAPTPPLGQQQQQAELMDIEQGACVGAGQLFEGLAPPSPLLQAARPDRSGRVSSSTAPGGSQQRMAGQKLGGAAPEQLVAATAAAAAAARRLGKQSLWSKSKPNASGQLELTGLSEEEQIKRAIEESMREQQQQQGAGVRLEPLMQDAVTSTAAPMETDKDVVVLDDEEATLQRVLAESAAAFEQQQQERLKQLQQQDGKASGLLAAAAAATMGEGQQDGTIGDGQGDKAAVGQQPKKERPPVLLLRLLEDSDYEAEQDGLSSRSSQGEGSLRSSSPESVDAAHGQSTAAAAAAAAGAAGAAGRPHQARRKRRARKQQQPQGPGGQSSAAAAASDGGRRQGAAKLRSQSTAAAAAGGDAGGAAAGHGSKSQPMEVFNGLDEDKENLVATAAAELADVDTVPDCVTSNAAAGKGGQQQKQKVRRALGEILGGIDSSARNAAAGAATTAAAAAAGDPPQKPPAVAAAVAAAQAAAAGSNAAAAVGPADGVQQLQDGVAAGAVGSWPQEAAASYSLSAVVRHMGELVSVGHFTSDVLNHKINRWFHYDDSRVHALNSIETVARLCQRDGYLFFYVNDAIIGEQ